MKHGCSVGFADSSPLGEQLGPNSSPQGEVAQGECPGTEGVN